jgi:hypothetical protein
MRSVRRPSTPGTVMVAFNVNNTLPPGASDSRGRSPARAGAVREVSAAAPPRPYESGRTTLPIDLLAGDHAMRRALTQGLVLASLERAWRRDEAHLARPAPPVPSRPLKHRAGRRRTCRECSGCRTSDDFEGSPHGAAWRPPEPPRDHRPRAGGAVRSPWRRTRLSRTPGWWPQRPAGYSRLPSPPEHANGAYRGPAAPFRARGAGSR